MRIVGYPRSFYALAEHGPVEVSAQAWDRLRWLKAWRALRERGLTSQEAAETLHLPRSTLYRWERRLNWDGPRGLEERSRRPRRVQRRRWRHQWSE